jgi:hypothetical protein
MITSCFVIEVHVTWEREVPILVQDYGVSVLRGVMEMAEGLYCMKGQELVLHYTIGWICGVACIAIGRMCKVSDMNSTWLGKLRPSHITHTHKSGKCNKTNDVCG